MLHRAWSPPPHPPPLSRLHRRTRLCRRALCPRRHGSARLARCPWPRGSMHRRCARPTQRGRRMYRWSISRPITSPLYQQRRSIGARILVSTLRRFPIYFFSLMISEVPILAELEHVFTDKFKHGATNSGSRSPACAVTSDDRCGAAATGSRCTVGDPRSSFSCCTVGLSRI